MNKEGAEIQLENLKNEAEFIRNFNIIFNMPEGQQLLEYILNLGNFGGIIKGEQATGAHNVVSQLWIEVIKAAPDAAKKLIDKMHLEFRLDRQEQFKQAETQLKEVDDE